MQTIFITGTNRGIGLELARQYAARGELVFAAARTRSDILATHPNVIHVPLEVTNTEQIHAARKIVREYTESLDILINNAGIYHRSDALSEVDVNQFLASMAVNAAAPIQIIQHFDALLRPGSPTQVGSKIVNLTMPTPPISKYNRTDDHSYVVSRYALNALTKMAALELGKRRIITVALYPGYIRTDMNNYADAAEPAEAEIPKLIDLIDRLTDAENGLCLLPNGKPYEW